MWEWEPRVERGRGHPYADRDLGVNLNQSSAPRASELEIWATRCRSAQLPGFVGERSELQDRIQVVLRKV